MVSRRAELQVLLPLSFAWGSRSCWVRVSQAGSLSSSLSGAHGGFSVCSDGCKPGESKDLKVGSGLERSARIIQCNLPSRAEVSLNRPRV